MTGTIASGAVTVGDAVMVSPPGLRARIRSIHAQNRPAERAIAGQRCALNLAGERISKEAIARGDVIVQPDLHAPTRRIDAELRVLAGEPKPLGNWFPAQLHHGSAKIGVHVVPLGPAIAPGGAGLVQFVLQQPVTAAIGDRFVLRDVSAQRTIGGGRFLDLRAPSRKRRTPERLSILAALAEPDPAAALHRLLSIPPFLVDLTAFARDHALLLHVAAGLSDATGTVGIEIGADRFLLSRQQWTRLASCVETEVSRFHEESPDLQGIGRERLRLRVEPRLPPPVFAAMLQRQVQAGTIVLDGSFVRLPGHQVRLGEGEEEMWRAIAPHLAGEQRFRPPRVRDLAALLHDPEAKVRRLLKLCGRLGRVDEIAQDHFFARDTTAEMIAILREAAARSPDGSFTAADIRDLMSNGRKVAIQILEFFDRHGVTRRSGDRRRINPQGQDLFAGGGS